MAEIPREDRPNIRPDIAEVKSLESRNESSKESEGRSLSSNDLKDAENKSGLYRATDNFQRLKLLTGIGGFFWGNKLRKSSTISGATISLIVIGSFFGLTIISGPAQLIQLSDILQKNFSGTNKTSSNRGSKLLRYAGTDDTGEAQLSLLGRKVFRSTLTRLEDIGIKLNTSNGSVDSAEINTDTLAKSYPELNSMTKDERMSFLADKFGINVDQINAINDTIFSTDAPFFSIKSTRALIGNFLSLLSDGKIMTAMEARTFREYLGLPSIFHPISRLAEIKLNDLITKDKAKAYAQQQEEKANSGVEESASPAVAQEEGDTGFSIKGSVTSALALAGAACFVRGVAKDINTINRDRIVLPAVIQALSFISLGSQIQSGKVSPQQVGAYSDSLTNSNNQSIWSAKSLKVTEGNTNASSGTDLSSGYQQAFSGSSIALKLTEWADVALAVFLVPASKMCSGTGIAAQVAAQVGLGIVSLFASVGSGGTLTPGMVAAWSAKEALAAGETLTAMNLIKDFVLNKTTDTKLPKGAFSGPLGGNLLAYGAREAANIVSVASGGVQLSSTTSSKIAYDQQLQSEKQFRSESLFARLFNINDYRSLLGRLADNISPSISENITTFASDILNVGQVIPKLFGDLITKVGATATQTYNWGFHQYGIPDSVLNNPAMANPYSNANKVMALLAGSSGPSYLQKIQTCFGVTVDPSTGVITPGTIVNTISAQYTSANCNDTSTNWERIMLFVADTRTMQAIACYQGGTQTCSDLGW